jgi:hypothetical protein
MIKQTQRTLKEITLITLDEGEVLEIIASHFDCKVDEIEFDISSQGLLRGVEITIIKRETLPN